MSAFLTYEVHGDFKRTKSFLGNLKFKALLSLLDEYGKKGVEALSMATPVRTGKTAASWRYKIEYGSDYVAIVWDNTNKVKGYPIAILLQYGHGTRGGGYVQGRDYINPAIRPIFDELAESAWRRFLSK